MAEHTEAQDRTEQPTAKRLQDAREKGRVARSHELTTVLLLLGSAAALYLSGTRMLDGLAHIMTANLALGRADLFSAGVVGLRVQQMLLSALTAVAPVLGAAVLIALLGPLALGGWCLSSEALTPNFERLHPLKGLGRVFGSRGFVEMVKALVKFVLILTFAVAAFEHQRDSILALGRADIYSGLAHGAHLLFCFFVIVSSATIVVALVDVPFQLWEHRRQLRMSRQEIRDEIRESDGAPELKARIRAMQHEVARRRMLEEVPKAHVVVINPEHYAVALRFEPDSMRAPVVVAKGVDAIAANIREVARTSQVPLLSAPPLARTLYHTTTINHEIPTGLYVAVANVLAYAFQLRAGAAHVAPPRDLPIPDGLNF